MSLSPTATIRPVLSVRNLIIDHLTEYGIERIVDNVSFDLPAGSVLGIVGESGSGKTLTMLAVLGLMPSSRIRVTGGEILLEGQDLLKLSAAELRELRGRRLAMIFQDPMTSLNPVISVGKQIGEIIQIHRPGIAKTELRERVVDLLALVGIPDPERRFRQFPHEFSGGMRQRAMIAMAVANEPTLLIADEPTTALDVTIQAQVMEVLAAVRARTGAAMMLVTHDLGLIAETADHVGVMYGGRMLEFASAEALFTQPSHPYTVGLLRSLPRPDTESSDLYSIAGQPPAVGAYPSGCVFHPRCSLRRDRALCWEEEPERRTIGAAHESACHFIDEVQGWSTEAASEPGSQAVRGGGEDMTAAVPTYEDDLLMVDGLHTYFHVPKARGWGKDVLKAVNGVSFTLARGTTLGLVGESGCGKSTLGRTLLGLIDGSAGIIMLKGHALEGARRTAEQRRAMQVVFQDPYASLDPRLTVHEVIAEPLRINGCYRRERVDEVIESVGLSPALAMRRPTDFSGGQRQRIAVARALALEPEVLILDEAVSALDMSIQAQVLNLLKSLQQRLGLAYLFISHNISVIRQMSDQVAVMYLGHIVEFGDRRKVLDSPRHPYTQSLLSAVPRPEPRGRHDRARIILEGDLPNPIAPPSGCVFRTRCFKARDVCATRVPALEPLDATDHRTACFFPDTEVHTEGRPRWESQPAPRDSASPQTL